MAAAAALLFLIVPSTRTFIDGISSRSMWAELHQRLLPEDRWFGVFVERGRLAAAPPETAPQTTGSLPSASPEAAPAQSAP
jgi:hypothetical protein